MASSEHDGRGLSTSMNHTAVKQRVAKLARRRRAAAGLPMAKKQLGQKIKELRNQLGWSKAGLARKADMHRAHLAQVELGQWNVRLRTLFNLARAFNVKLSYLFKGIA